MSAWVRSGHRGELRERTLWPRTSAGIQGDAAMNVERILERKGTEVAAIVPEASIKRAADWLRAKNVGALVVTSNDAILGIISERDIVRAFSQHGEPVASMQ